MNTNLPLFEIATILDRAIREPIDPDLEAPKTQDLWNTLDDLGRIIKKVADAALRGALMYCAAELERELGSLDTAIDDYAGAVGLAFEKANEAAEGDEQLADAIFDAYDDQLADEWARLRLLPPSPATVPIDPPGRPSPRQRAYSPPATPGLCGLCETKALQARGYAVTGAPKRHAEDCPKRRRRQP